MIIKQLPEHLVYSKYEINVYYFNHQGSGHSVQNRDYVSYAPRGGAGWGRVRQLEFSREHRTKKD